MTFLASQSTVVGKIFKTKSYLGFCIEQQCFGDMNKFNTKLYFTYRILADLMVNDYETVDSGKGHRTFDLQS